MTAQSAPWFEFSLEGRVPAWGFSPQPSVDGGLLAITRRGSPLVPDADRRGVRRVRTGHVHGAGRRSPRDRGDSRSPPDAAGATCGGGLRRGGNVAFRAISVRRTGQRSGIRSLEGDTAVGGRGSGVEVASTHVGLRNALDSRRVIGVVSDGAAITRVMWRSTPPEGVVVPQDPAADPLLAEALAQITAYFDGTLRRFEVPIDLGEQTAATRAVLTALHETVWQGETITYGGLAARSGHGGACQGHRIDHGREPRSADRALPFGSSRATGSADTPAVTTARDSRPSAGCSSMKGLCRRLCSEPTPGFRHRVISGANTLREWTGRVPSRGANVQFISTRGGMQPRSRSARRCWRASRPDGGLAVPEVMPTVDGETLERWRALTYPQLATEVLGLFATDIPRADLARMTDAAYADFPTVWCRCGRSMTT